MRTVPILKDQYYHVYTRGVDKQVLFRSTKEYARMLFLILYSQSKETFKTSRHVDNFMNTGGDFKVDSDLISHIVKNRIVEVVNFCIMSNHFHITLHNVAETGVSEYMQRIQLAYAVYFNKKNDRSGHVFQGAYGAVHVTDENQLAYLSAYIHKNPRELKSWKNREETYPWSSYPYYVSGNNLQELLVPDAVLERFTTPLEYFDFVKKCSAKEIEENTLF